MSTSNRLCSQCSTPLAPYETVCSNCGKHSVEPTQLASSSLSYASPAMPGQSSIEPTQYGPPPLSNPYGSSPYGDSSSSLSDPYGSSPYESSSPSTAPPPPFGGSLSAPPQKKKSRRGLWIVLAAIGAVLIIGVILVAVLGSGANASTPTKTLNAFCTAVKEHDANTAYQQFSNAAQTQITQAQFAQNIVVFNDCTVGRVDDAVGTGTLTYSLTGGLKLTEDDRLVKENGTWKINAQQVQSTPTLTLVSYCAALKKGDFQTAYNQFSQNYRSGQSEEQFASGFTQPVVNCTLSNINDSAGTGRVTYTYSNGTQFGDETLVDENGTWKINAEKLTS